MKSLRRSVALAATGVVALAATSFVATSSQAADGDKTYLILETDASGAVWTYGDQTQLVVPEKDCSVVSGADGALASLAATGGGKSTLGFTNYGFGVKSKGPGQNCGEVSNSQSLTVALGDIAGPGEGVDPVYRLITDAELDVEAKFSCELMVDYFRGDVRIGTQTVPLSERADCGPDSNDNVRAALSVPSPGADRIVLKPGADGAISLEGGFESGPVISDGLVALAELDTKGSVFELTEGAGIIPEAGQIVIRDPSGAVATIENAASQDGLDIPYFTEPCVDDEPCVNFKLLPEAGAPDFYRLTAYVSIPVDDPRYQQLWDGEIDFDGNGGNSFTLGELSTGSENSCKIDETVLEPQACITKFVYPDPQDGTVNPELTSDSGTTYRTDIWDLWISDPNIR